MTPEPIAPGIRTTLSVLADIHAELASRMDTGSGSSEHVAPVLAPAAKAQKVA